MSHVLNTVFEYQSLIGKRDHLGLPLSLNESLQASALHRMLSTYEEPDGGEATTRIQATSMENRATPRHLLAVTALFTSASGFEEGVLRNVSSFGLAISTRQPLPVGWRTLVLVVLDSEEELIFPCRVAWQKNRGTRHGMGLAFDGMPTRSAANPEAWPRPESTLRTGWFNERPKRAA